MTRDDIVELKTSDTFINKAFGLACIRNRMHDYDLRLLTWQIENKVVLLTKRNTCRKRDDASLVIYGISTIASPHVDKALLFAYGYVDLNEEYKDLEEHPSFNTDYEYGNDTYNIKYYNSLGEAHMTKYLNIYKDKECTTLGWNINKEIILDILNAVEKVRYYVDTFNFDADQVEYRERLNYILYIDTQLKALARFKRDKDEYIAKETYDALYFGIEDIYISIMYLAKMIGLKLAYVPNTSSETLDEALARTKDEVIALNEPNNTPTTTTYKEFIKANCISMKNNLMSKYSVEEAAFIGSFPIGGNMSSLIARIKDLEIKTEYIINNIDNELVFNGDATTYMKEISPKMIPGMLAHYTALYKNIRVNDAFIIPSMEESIKQYLTYFIEEDSLYKIKDENVFDIEKFSNLRFTYNQLYTMVSLSYKAFLAEVQLFLYLRDNEYIKSVEYNSIMDSSGIDIMIKTKLDNNAYGIMSYKNDGMSAVYHKEKMKRHPNIGVGYVPVEMPLGTQNVIETNSGLSIRLYSEEELEAFIIGIIDNDLTHLMNNGGSENHDIIAGIRKNMIYSQVDTYIEMKSK